MNHMIEQLSAGAIFVGNILSIILGIALIAVGLFFKRKKKEQSWWIILVLLGIVAVVLKIVQMMY
ncbi:LPXTG cell wall anchor domain-containing protein [Desulfitobacterium sp. Sab5]|uniref:LPXTG cell wall anchor domain-containing protein n=1 Tax=Desulfitobacterium nosdiversum TaxID=3375356 RepID=UPI003CF97F35